MDSSVKITNKKKKQSTNDVSNQTKNYDNKQLPEEVLEMIFSHLTYSCNDMINLSRASKDFSRIVHPSAHLWLLEKVFPFIFPHLNKPDILNCRLTCKMWKTGVTTFLRNHPPCYIDTNYHPPTISPLAFHKFPSLMTKDLFCIEFQRARHIRRFQKQMRHHSGNPFVLDLIMFTNQDELFNYYWDHMYELLSKFGHHITRITLNLDSNHRPKPLAKFKVFREVLLRLPNLKYLGISGLLSSSAKHKEYSILEDTFNKLKNYVEKHPLPQLPHLESISLNDDKFDLATCPFLLSTLLKSYGSQVTTLSKNIRTWKTNDFHSTNFPKLVDIYIVNCSKYLESSTVLEKLIAPNLQKLTISGAHLDGEKQLPSLFKSLLSGNFPLRYLTLKYYISEKLPQGPVDESYPILQSVSTLEIVECREKPNKVPFEKVLRALPNLEYIFMCSDITLAENLENQTKRGVGELKEDCLQIREWAARGQMYKCSVWELLPKLREISFGFFGDHTTELSTEVMNVKTFTREKYNYFRSRPVEV